MVTTLNLMREIFKENKQLTLNQLYDILSQNPKFTLSESKMRHRIRSSIYTLKKNKEIMRVKDSTYEKIN